MDYIKEIKKYRARHKEKTKSKESIKDHSHSKTHSFAKPSKISPSTSLPYSGGTDFKSKTIFSDKANLYLGLLVCWIVLSHVKDAWYRVENLYYDITGGYFYAEMIILDLAVIAAVVGGVGLFFKKKWGAYFLSFYFLGYVFSFIWPDYGYFYGAASIIQTVLFFKWIRKSWKTFT